MNYHQGDVYLEKIDSIPSNAKLLRKDIVQFGEITGHAHKIAGSEIYEENRILFLKVKTDGVMTHEDHPKIENIKEGTYRCRIQQEYFPDGFRNVKD